MEMYRNACEKGYVYRSVLKKGFVEISSRDHIYYRFVQPNGKITPLIKTKMSHGSGKDISDDLLTKMSRQLMFDKKADLMKFVECDLSGDDYYEILKDKGIIQC
jgi:hypothetical protein